MPPVCHGHATCESPAKRLGRAFQCNMRSGGRVVEGARLESEYTSKAYRGFESLPLRQVFDLISFYAPLRPKTSAAPAKITAILDAAASLVPDGLVASLRK